MTPGPTDPQSPAAGAEKRRRLCVYNGGLLGGGRIGRILDLAGWQVTLGLPGDGDWVGVWGQSPTAPRGEAIAGRMEAPVLRIEDAFLRSVLTGREGAPPIGLNLDRSGLHFDPRRPSDLETLLATAPLDDTALLDRARAAADALRRLHLSKYNAFDPAHPLPPSPYVLVIDQTLGDASVAASGGDRGAFLELLVMARMEHPGLPVVIKSHPETAAAGGRAGHFRPEDAVPGVRFCAEAVSPWALMAGAVAVYTLSSQLGFEAIFAGHRPRVLGQPFYAGWGLTLDENPPPRRSRKLSRAQLFAGAMMLYPTWYDPCRDRLCELEDVIAQLTAEARAWREDHKGYVATGMKPWKEPHVRAFFAGSGQVEFASAPRAGQRHMAWASRLPADAAAGGEIVRIEDGFIRSRGLGARLVAPLSLVADDLGIYYDPARESRLERLIATAAEGLAPDQRARAEAIIAALCRTGVTKYNTGGAAVTDLPAGPVILVPGQVEDDASVLAGCSEVATNADLLRRARAANPGAVLLYKPHPDVEAGLRRGRVPADVLALADRVLDATDPAAALGAADAVWTMTSLMGFEALLRGKAVTCLGMPFYAGWGLTADLVPAPARRSARPDLVALVHAALIDYPRYRDPVSGLPCPAEVVLERIARDEIPVPPLATRLWALLNRFRPRRTG